MSPAASGSVPIPTRKPSLKHERDRSHPRERPSSPRTASFGNGIAKGNETRRVSANAITFVEDEDIGLIMRDREKERAERAEREGRAEGRPDRDRDRDETSIGKAGGVGMGVTRPKRRLSSLPSLPHPILSSRPLSATASPPHTPPNGHAHTQHTSHHNYPHPPPYSSHYPSTYHALQAGLSAPMNGYAGKMDEKAPLNQVYAATPTKEKDGPPTLFGIELKWVSLVTLALQNALLTIIMHYSRITAAPSKTYSAASAVLLNELLKGSISVFIALKRIDSALPPPTHPSGEKSPRPLESPRSSRLPSFLHTSRIRKLREAVFSPDCYKLSVPAILYVIQNNLQYVAASNLDVATFQVTYQMKILTTAFFSVLVLRKRLSKAKWAALVMLAVGVAIVQLQSTSVPTSMHQNPSQVSPRVEPPHARIGRGHALRSEIPDIAESDVTEKLDFTKITELSAPSPMRPFRGFLAVTLACMTSGLAGVYFEFILKSSGSGPSASPPPDLWVRNTQLSLFSLVPAVVPILFYPSGPAGVGWLGRVMASFSNFNGWAIGTVLTQTLGGLITAVVIRYSDNIMKGFATSLSIIISFLASVALFSYPITVTFLVGSSVVLLATLLYNAPASPTPQTRKEVAVAPDSPIGSRAPIIGEPEKPSRTGSMISLLGLSSGSGTGTGTAGNGSARPSFTDLRAMASGLHFTPAQTPSQSHVYAASAPGTPYLSSGYPSSASLYDGRVSPGLLVLPPRARDVPPPRRGDSSGSGSPTGSGKGCGNANGIGADGSTLGLGGMDGKGHGYGHGHSGANGIGNGGYGHVNGNGGGSGGGQAGGRTQGRTIRSPS